MKLLNLAFWILNVLLLISCDQNEEVVHHEDQSSVVDEESIVDESIEDSLVVHKDSIQINEDERIERFLELMYARFQENQIRVPYEKLNQRTAKHLFTYNDEFIGIDINVDDFTYKGIYSINDEDTIIRYVSVIPEMEMEGSFINYNNKPTLEYYFQNDELTKVICVDPKDSLFDNPYKNMTNSELAYTADTIKLKLRKYFYVDSLKFNFEGDWKYIQNNDKYMFSAQLNSTGSFISGSYCAYTPNQYDCENEQQGGDRCTVNGYVIQDTLFVNYHSCYAGKKGNAKLYFENDTLIWYNQYRPDGSLAIEKGKLLSN